MTEYRFFVAIFSASKFGELKNSKNFFKNLAFHLWLQIRINMLLYVFFWGDQNG